MEYIYGLTQGAYSDWRVLALFEDKREAERARKVLGGDDDVYGPDVIVFSFYRHGDVPAQIKVHYYSIVLMDNGAQLEERHRIETQWDYTVEQYVGKRPWVRFVRAPIYRNAGGRLEITGTDESAVFKTSSDMIAQWKAQDYRLNEVNR